MSLHPVGPRVLVRPAPPKTETPSGIALPTGDMPTTGVVVAVGTTRIVNVARGTTVVFAPFAGAKVVDEDTGEELLVLMNDEIIARVRPAKPCDVCERDTPHLAHAKTGDSQRPADPPFERTIADDLAEKPPAE